MCRPHPNLLPRQNTDHYFTTSWQDIQDKVGSTTTATYYWSTTYTDSLIARDNSAGTRIYAYRSTLNPAEAHHNNRFNNHAEE